MTLIRVPNAGSAGLNKDLSKHELPVNAWTDSLNIRFLDGYAWQFYGHGEVYNSPSVIPYHLIPVTVGTANYWLYASLAKIYAVTLSGGVATHTNLTRQSVGVDQDYSAQPNAWTSALLGGIPVLNAGNETNYPQQWDLNIANRCTNLSNWPANTYCKALRSYNNYLIALNITKTTTNYPFMVKWSHPADPGAVPTSWDETDATKDAGEFDLAEGYDIVVDGLQLRDSFIVYKKSSAWRMDYIGGVYVFRFQKLPGINGVLNRNCVVEVDGMHVVFTGSDVIVHDGQSVPVSVLDKQMRRWLFQDIDSDYIDRCFLFKNPFFNEVFICYPEVGETIPNKAVVWNYKDKTVSIRELPSIHHANCGMIEAAVGGTWAQDPAPWNSDITSWNSADYVPPVAKCLMGANAQKLYLLDSSSSFDGEIPSAYLERCGLSFGEPEKRKLVRGIRPRITGNDGETVLIKVGYQDDPWDAPTYGDTITHIIGSTVLDFCMVGGRYIAIRFESGTAYQWRLDSYDIDVVQVGEW